MASFGKPFSGAKAIDGATAPRGIFGEHPSSTPKYVLGAGARRDFTETMARLYVTTSGPVDKQRFLDSVRQDSPEAASPTSAVLAKALTAFGYLDFLLQRVTHPNTEKAEVIETIADSHVAYYFGRGAPIYQYGGVVVNSTEDDQAVNLFRMYRDILRGSQLARRRKLVSLAYDSYIVSGSLMNLEETFSAENEMVVGFGFQLLAESVFLRPNFGAFGLVVAESDFDPDSIMKIVSATGGVTGTYRLSMVAPAKTPASEAPPTDTSAQDSTKTANTDLLDSSGVAGELARELHR